MKEINDNKCQYLNKLLDSRKQLEQLRLRQMHATQLHEEYQERFRKAGDMLHKLKSQSSIQQGIYDNARQISNSDYCRMQRKPRGRPKRGYVWVGEKDWGCYEKIGESN